jgi:hypothetical protein
MSARAKGLVKSPRHWKGLGHPHYLSAVLVPPAAEVTLPPPLDQGDLGSCTGNAFALALQIEMQRARPSLAVELPSRLFLYFNARKKEGSEAEDSGAMLSDIFDGAVALGFPPESAWPYPDPADSGALLERAVTEPALSAYERAFDQRIVHGVHRLESVGQALSDDIAAAIAAGQVVVWGTDLDQAFEDLEPGRVWPGVKGPVLGGHAMVLHAYRTVGMKRSVHPHEEKSVLGAVNWPVREFKTRSSWGEWCDGGSAWVSQDAIESPHASEFFAIALVDRYSEVAS